MKLSKYSSLSLVLCGFSLFLLSLLTNCSTSDPAPPPTPATPVAVAPQVTAVSTTGFTLSFDVAVPELTAADLILTNKATSVTPADTSNKIYTVVTSAVAAGSSFTVSLKKEGYTFTPATLTISVPAVGSTAVTATVSNPSTTGFTLTLNVAVADFAKDDITLAPAATISSVTAVVGTDNKVFTVVTSPLTAGTTYNATLAKTGYSFVPQPVMVAVPASGSTPVNASISLPSAAGFTLTLNVAVADFAKADITLNNSATVTTVTPDATNTIFTILTSPLTAGTSYTATLSKTGYSFTPQAPSFTVPAAAGSTNITAFTIADASGTAQPATIDQTAKTISFAALNLCGAPTALTPTVTVGSGYTVAPTTAQDFTKDVTYTVKDAAGTVVNTYTAKAITATLPKLTLGTSTAAVSHRYVVFYYRLTDASGSTTAFSTCTAKYNFVVLPTATAAPANAAAVKAYAGALTLNAKGSEERAAMLFLPGTPSFDANGTPNATLDASTAYTLYAAAEGSTTAPVSIAVKTGAVMMDSPFRITRNSKLVTKLYCSSQYGYVAASGLPGRTTSPIALNNSQNAPYYLFYRTNAISDNYNKVLIKLGVTDFSHTDEIFIIRKTTSAAGTNADAPNPFDFGNIDFIIFENNGGGPLQWTYHYTDTTGDDRYMENGNKYQTTATGTYPTTPTVE